MSRGRKRKKKYCLLDVRITDRQGVNENGLKAPSSIGGCIFGMGIILDSFQITGTIPDRSNVLKMVVMRIRTG